MRTFTSTDEL
jgi:acyl dehydratase